MRIIGLTGGIGSGKSTVSQILKEKGAIIIDADIIAREVVAGGQKALEEIKEHFGKEILDNKGELDRKKLGDIVFNNSKELSVLNGITHKYIVNEIKRRVAKAMEEKQDIVVIDAAIPFEHGFIDVADEIWVVCAKRDLRIKRIIERNVLSRADALKRIESQKNDEEYMNFGDRIISNNGTIGDLTLQVLNALNSEHR